jgi:hypothetical protein
MNTTEPAILVVDDHPPPAWACGSRSPLADLRIGWETDSMDGDLVARH